MKTVEDIQKIIKEKTGKHVEVMVYGDGAFKDPVVSPGYTAGLKGTPIVLIQGYFDNYADE
jgi:hypothetical protein